MLQPWSRIRILLDKLVQAFSCDDMHSLCLSHGRVRQLTSNSLASASRRRSSARTRYGLFLYRSRKRSTRARASRTRPSLRSEIVAHLSREGLCLRALRRPHRYHAERLCLASTNWPFVSRAVPMPNNLFGVSCMRMEASEKRVATRAVLSRSLTGRPISCISVAPAPPRCDRPPCLDRVRWR